MAQKRTLDSFLHTRQSPFKKARVDVPSPTSGVQTALDASKPASDDAPSNHSTYPYPIAQLPPHITAALSEVPEAEGKEINDQPDLDLLYFQPFVPRRISRDLFNFLRESLFFYRVRYTIKRGPTETQINTPRYTTVFGVDTSCHFSETGGLVSAATKNPVPANYYACKPRPLPGCLEALKQLTEVFTGATYNFCLVNYYATGNDSISYHSDDERFLGKEPAIASFSLGAKRDFLMRHKPPTGANVDDGPVAGKKAPPEKPLKLPLGSGDMVLMRGSTQANWLHSIPKRKGGEADEGRINITFRKALVKGGTENYYRYNVGAGEVYKWDRVKREMIECKTTEA
jgi:alkylated DNA repair dioxygenase AlkB